MFTGTVNLITTQEAVKEDFEDVAATMGMRCTIYKMRATIAAVKELMGEAYDGINPDNLKVGDIPSILESALQNETTTNDTQIWYYKGVAYSLVTSE